MAEQPFSHLDAAGQVHMVDVGAKDTTDRVATAEARVVRTTSSGEPGGRSALGSEQRAW